MASGIPVVYSNYSGHADFAYGLPVNVRLFPEQPYGSAIALADTAHFLQQVLKYMDNDGLRREHQKKAVKRAERMSWDRYTSKWIETFEKLMKI